MVSDAYARIPEKSRDRLAALAAAEGMPLRAYVAQLAETLLTPDERAARAEQTRAALKECNGYAPTQAEEGDPDSEPDRRLAQAGPRGRHRDGRGRATLSPRLIHRAHAEAGWYLYAPACALVKADRARPPGTAEHLARCRVSPSPSWASRRPRNTDAGSPAGA